MTIILPFASDSVVMRLLEDARELSAVTGFTVHEVLAQLAEDAARVNDDMPTSRASVASEHYEPYYGSDADPGAPQYGDDFE